jgi:hypothetical protein
MTQPHSRLVPGVALGLALVAALAGRPAERPAADPSSATSSDDDRQALQSRWERKLTSGDPDAHGAARAVKEISNARERVTYFDAAGQAVYETTADFTLEHPRPVKLYTYSDFKVVKGEQKGADAPKGAVSYIYRVEGDLYYEAHGLLDTSPPNSKPVVVTWKRVK